MKTGMDTDQFERRVIAPLKAASSWKKKALALDVPSRVDELSHDLTTDMLCQVVNSFKCENHARKMRTFFTLSP